MRLILATALLIVASPAMAQNSNTTCATTFGQTNCQTRTEPTIDWGILNRRNTSNDAFNQGRAIGEAARRREEDRKPRLTVAPPVDWVERGGKRVPLTAIRDSVADQLSKGNCADAIGMALFYGQIELATQAKLFCATPAPAP